jgi:transposase
MEHFFEKNQSTKAASWTHGELLERYGVIEAELLRVLQENYKLRDQRASGEQLRLLLAEQLEALRAAEYGASSERYKKPETTEREKIPPKPRVKKPSERYPNIPVREEEIAQDPAPHCSCCGETMTDSGMREESEQLTVIPKKYEILRQLRVKYSCSCHGSIVTAPAPARIIEGSSYSDEMIVDVVLSKYCDLIPIERYVAMARRGGLKDLPAQSLIELSHQFADFVSPAYILIKRGVLEARVFNADETPHRMLEGSDRKTWYLWGFSTTEHCFLECHSTRSGDVASDVLIHSKGEVLVSDVYSGYGKAVRLANDQRRLQGRPLIRNAYCNAHARRYFYKNWPKFQEAGFYLDHYHEIYRLEAAAKGQAPTKVIELRSQMESRFAAMKKRAMEELPGYPEQGKYYKALKYFLGNFEGLTVFIGDAGVPIDNNSQERLLRNHVVGRKTWYGTHSERGALTAAVIFTVVETCKLNGVNPREYFKALVQDLLAGKPPRTPSQFRIEFPAA